jgi:predicted pyridoxine 5'-phosphate oxidase superfamily flavin-nucleotide-binding protein
MTDAVKKVFAENPWFLATFDEEPNVVPVGFKCIGEDGKFYVGAVLLDTTLKNIEKNGKIAIAAVSGAESYQVKGRAEFVTEGPMFDFFEKLTVDTFGGKLHAKCAVAVTPEKLIVASPNADNRKELEL